MTPTEQHPERYDCYGQFQKCAGEGLGCWEKEACKRATQARISGVT